MNRILWTVAPMALLVCFVLLIVSCSSEYSATLQVEIGAAETAANPAVIGHTCYCVVYAPGGVLGVSPVLAANSFLLTAGTTFNSIMLDPASGETWMAEWGQSYDVYVWVDVNDNYPTPNTPESAVDYRSLPFPFAGVRLNSECTEPENCNAVMVSALLVAP